MKNDSQNIISDEIIQKQEIFGEVIYSKDH